MDKLLEKGKNEVFNPLSCYIVVSEVLYVFVLRAHGGSDPSKGDRVTEVILNMG